MDAYEYPASHRIVQAPSEFPLSPLDALGKASRLARKESLLGQASREQQSRAGGVPSRGASLREREMRLELGGKGKGREEREEELWESGGTSPLRGEVGEEQYARDTREQRGEHQPSPFLKHAFHSSIASTSLTEDGSPQFDPSDLGDSSPVMPAHRSDPRGAHSSALQPSPSALPAQTYTPSHAYTPSLSTDQALSRASSNASQQRRVTAELQRNPSGRRYPGLDAEDETELLRGDRSTWHSEYDTQRESVANSTNGDPFHYSMYESLPSPSHFQADPSAPLPISTSALSQSPPSSYPTPTVRIGAPSPATSDDERSDPHASRHWDNPSPSPTSSHSASPSTSGFGFLAHTPRTTDTAPPPLSTSRGRVRSHTLTKNFSRPFSGTPIVRSDLYKSFEGGAHLSSSHEHSSHEHSSHEHSSQGAHSTSRSWEGRNEMEVRYRQGLQTGGESGRSTSVEELRSTPMSGARSLDSPAPFTRFMTPSPGPDYSPPSRDANLPSSNSPIHPYAAARSAQFAPFRQFQPDEGSHLDRDHPSPLSTPTIAFPPSHSTNDLEPHRPRTADSSKSRNTLKKPPPVPRSQHKESPHHHTGWNIFGSRSRSKSRTRQVDNDSDNRLSGTTIRNEAPTITFSEHLPPVEHGMSPDGIARRAKQQEEQRRQWEREVQPSVAQSVAAGFVRGAGAPLPGWSGEEVERLEEPSGAMRRSVSDVGPQRHDRALSAHSVYSDYSYYDLGPESEGRSAKGSPRGGSGKTFAGEQAATASKATAGLRKASALGRNKTGMLEAPSVAPESPDDFLQLGIDYHEDGQLERATWYFEQAAKKYGGCGAGMLMYGLSLRHGWGCQVNAPLGFSYIQRAAESVVEDLDRVVGGHRAMSGDEMSAKAVKNELVLALHELGTSFRFGWGVEKDKKMAVSYFKLAADLGDPDAQTELAFCYASGKGCKKDMRLAAKYYRLAVAQGGETFGLSWIYKPKYMD